MICSQTELAAETTQAFIVCVVSSHSWAVFLTPAIILVSAALAAWGVLFARGSARKRATLDMIEKFESTKHYRDLRGTFSYYRRAGGFERLHNPKEEKDNAERQSVLEYLNHYELVAIGICNDILDAKIYRQWMLGPFVRDWNAASDFIQRERWKLNEKTQEWQYRYQLFENYQSVATKWSEEAINLTRESSEPPTKAEGPGDDPLPDSDANSRANQ